MISVLLAAGWLAGLAIALYASEQLVTAITALAEHWRLSAAIVGLTIAAGADSPEVTSALVAVSQGKADVGFGVVVGSNVYNLAFLLGLSAIVAGGISTGQQFFTGPRVLNLILTGLVAILAAAVESAKVVAVVLFLVLAAYLMYLATRGTEAPPPASPTEEEDCVEWSNAQPLHPRPPRHRLWVAIAAVVAIVAGSDLLVQTSIRLAPILNIPAGIVGTFVLAIATSLPNTWAAVSLARRGHAPAAIATTFNSNSINLAAGIGIPTLLLGPTVTHAARLVDIPALLVMTVAALALLASRHRLNRWEGGILLGLYGLYVAVRLVLVGGG